MLYIPIGYLRQIFSYNDRTAWLTDELLWNAHQQVYLNMQRDGMLVILNDHYRQLMDDAIFIRSITKEVTLV